MSKIESQKTLINAQIIDITQKLKSYDIPLDLWGTGEAKTIEHLVKEILEGETVLVEKNGEIIRKVEFVRLDVRHNLKDVELQLVEDRQVFKDGRERRRGLSGIGEKMKPGEDPIASARRALAEELGINDECDINNLEPNTKSLTSPSYPGLLTEFLIHDMRTNLPDSAYRRDGYVEVQPDKTTYFVWREVK
jgi:hypothetical protein